MGGEQLDLSPCAPASSLPNPPALHSPSRAFVSGVCCSGTPSSNVHAHAHPQHCPHSLPSPCPGSGSQHCPPPLLPRDPLPRRRQLWLWGLHQPPAPPASSGLAVIAHPPRPEQGTVASRGLGSGVGREVCLCVSPWVVWAQHFVQPPWQRQAVEIGKLFLLFFQS